MSINARGILQRQPLLLGLSYRWAVIGVVISGAFMVGLDQTAVNIAIPRLPHAFGVDIQDAHWVITAYLLTLAVITPLTPYLAQNLGLKRVYIFSLGAFILGAALCVLARTLPLLILCRILQGIGGAILGPLTLMLIFQEFSPEERGVAIGLYGIPLLVAPTLGPLVGNFLVTYISWRAIFFINVIIGTIALALALAILRDVRSERRTKLDLPGFVTLAYGLAAVLYAISEMASPGWKTCKIEVFLASGLLSLFAFVAIELITNSRGKQPLLNLRLFAHRSLAIGNLTLFLSVCIIFGSLFLLPLYLQHLRGLSAFQVSLMTLLEALAEISTLLIGGRLVCRIGVRAVVIPGVLLLGGVSLLLTRLTLFAPCWWLQLLLCLSGLAIGLVGQLPIATCMSRLHHVREIADGSTLLILNRALAASIGSSMLSILLRTREQIHFAHLAEHVTVTSRLGRFLPILEVLLVAHGIPARSAKPTALLLIAGYLQKQAGILALHDVCYQAIPLIMVLLFTVLCLREKGSATLSTHEHTQSRITVEAVSSSEQCSDCEIEQRHEQTVH